MSGNRLNAVAGPRVRDVIALQFKRALKDADVFGHTALIAQQFTSTVQQNKKQCVEMRFCLSHKGDKQLCTS
eukprot:m.459419 g.459419  ORF g.459419 m.459419 type:complete len:72 (+) comp21740_c0_seq1:1158-1373(+)